MTVDMLLLGSALAALDLHGKCGSYCSDPVPIAHPLCKPSVRDVYDVYNSDAGRINIPLDCWIAMTVAGLERKLSHDAQLARSHGSCHIREPWHALRGAHAGSRTRPCRVRHTSREYGRDTPREWPP